MKKTYLLLSLICVPLFLVRMFELTQQTDYQTGFYIGGNQLHRIAALLLLVATVVAVLRIYKKRNLCAPETISRDIMSAVLFALSGFFTLASSIAMYLSIKIPNPILHFFDSREQMRLYGASSPHFKMILVCVVLGVFAAAWFLLCAYCLFIKKEDVLRGNIFSALPVLWLSARAIEIFIDTPVNKYDSIRIVTMAGILMLAIFYLRFAQFFSISHSDRVFRGMVTTSMLAFLWIIGLGAATMIFFMRHGEFVNTVLQLTDCTIASAALFSVANLIDKGETSCRTEKLSES
ncbi:MAG: hypothetical protein RRY69_07540 [Oscillospiraceae bacterium]